MGVSTVTSAYCSVCGSGMASKQTCRALGIRFTEYYVLNAGSGTHICGKCLDDLVNTRIQGLVEGVERLRRLAIREGNLWEQRNRNLEDIMAFDVDTLPFEVMKEVCREIKKMLTQGERNAENNKEENSNED